MLKVGENVAAVGNRTPAAPSSGTTGTGRRSARPRYVEVPAAFVELKPGQAADEPELLAFCRREIELQGAAPRALRQRGSVDEQDPEVPGCAAIDRRAASGLTRYRYRSARAARGVPLTCFIATLRIKKGREAEFERLQRELSELTRAGARYTRVRASSGTAPTARCSSSMRVSRMRRHFSCTSRRRFISATVPPIIDCVDGEMDLQFFDWIG